MSFWACALLYFKNLERLPKTGSGQTYGKHFKKRTVFFCAAGVAMVALWCSVEEA
jgi:hypothetical protein